MTSIPSLRERVLAEAATTPARTRPESRRRAALVYTVAALAGPSLFLFWGGVAHAAARPRAFTIGIATGSMLLAFACAEVAWWRRTLLGRSGLALVMVTLMTPLLTCLWLVSFHARYPEPVHKLGVRCFTLMLVAGAPLLLAVLHLRKHTVVRVPALNGAALGCVAGAVASVIVDLWCPLTNTAHVILGHVLPLLVLCVAGALGGRRLLALRPRHIAVERATK